MQRYTKSAIVVLVMADFYEVLSVRLSSGRQASAFAMFIC
jgi:hypothetical protein